MLQSGYRFFVLCTNTKVTTTTKTTSMMPLTTSTSAPNAIPTAAPVDNDVVDVNVGTTERKVYFMNSIQDLFSLVVVDEKVVVTANEMN